MGDSMFPPGGPGLSLLRYAELLACEAEFSNVGEGPVLERLGVTREAAMRAKIVWPDRLADDLRRGDATLVVIFAAAYARIEYQLRLTHPPIENLLPDPELEKPKPQGGPFRASERPLQIPRQPVSDAPPLAIELDPRVAIPRGPRPRASSMPPPEDPISSRSRPPPRR